MNKYDVEGIVGEGAYGVVLRCRNKLTNETLAIKKFKEGEDDDVVRKTTLREVKILRMLKHPCIVNLREAFRRKGKLYLVFEYLERNLLEVLETHTTGLSADLVRRYIFQLCLAIEFCHRNGVIHRDIKPENLLVNPDHSLKLCDFGFARMVSSSDMGNLTDYVATRWYRAPELLLGSTDYTMKVDSWAIGCIMGELIDGQPLFPGESEVDQLYVIQKSLGPLTHRQMERFKSNPRFSGVKFPEIRRTETLSRRYGRCLNKRGLAFLKSLVALDPEKRLTSRECVNHPYFEGLKEEFGVADEFLESPLKLTVSPSSARQSAGSRDRGSETPSSVTLSRGRRSAAIELEADSGRRGSLRTRGSDTSGRAGDEESKRSGRERQRGHGSRRHRMLTLPPESKERERSGERKSRSRDPMPSRRRERGDRSRSRSRDPTHRSGRGVTQPASTGPFDLSSAARPSVPSWHSSRDDRSSRGERPTSRRSRAGGVAGVGAGAGAGAEAGDGARGGAGAGAGAGAAAGAGVGVCSSGPYHSITEAERQAKLRDSYWPMDRGDDRIGSGGGGGSGGGSEDTGLVDVDSLPIPAAPSAHIHAAARAIGSSDGRDDAADFDLVSHYAATRPTSGIRPRSGRAGRPPIGPPGGGTRAGGASVGGGGSLLVQPVSGGGGFGASDGSPIARNGLAPTRMAGAPPHGDVSYSSSKLPEDGPSPRRLNRIPRGDALDGPHGGSRGGSSGGGSSGGGGTSAFPTMPGPHSRRRGNAVPLFPAAGRGTGREHDRESLRERDREGDWDRDRDCDRERATHHGDPLLRLGNFGNLGSLLSKNDEVDVFDYALDGGGTPPADEATFKKSEFYVAPIPSFRS